MARIIFISGGVRSGKSQLAEQVAIDLAQTYDKQLHYVATGQPSDEEMSIRIQHHQQTREQSGQQWVTWEQPRDVQRLAMNFTTNDVLLLDCLTTLLNNEFFYEDRWLDPAFQQQIDEKLIEGLKELSINVHTLILVSNEVLHDVMSEEPLVKAYGRVLGRIHQQIVTLADEAYLVESGRFIAMKGRDEI